MPDRTRPGEQTVELPAGFDAGLYFVGRCRTPWTRREDCPKNSREARATCRIELDSRFAAGLRDVETASHLIVLTFLDRARRDLLVQAPSHYRQPHGTFALRSPMRPNPIGLNVVRLLKRDGAILEVVGLDCVDGTPLLDLKPYFPSTDSVPDAAVGWHAAEKG